LEKRHYVTCDLYPYAGQQTVQYNAIDTSAYRYTTWQMTSQCQCRCQYSAVQSTWEFQCSTKVSRIHLDRWLTYRFSS